MYIRDEELELMRVASGTPVGGEIPEEVLKAYEKYKRIWDRCSSSRLPMDKIFDIVFWAGGGEPCKADVKKFDILALGRAGEVKRGDVLEIFWKNEKMEAVFDEVTGRGKVKMFVGDEVETRELDPKVVLCVKGK